MIWIVLSVWSVLTLALDVDWGLRSYSVLGWGRTWFLRVASLLGNDLSIVSVRLVACHVVIQQIIVLLGQTE